MQYDKNFQYSGENDENAENEILSCMADHDFHTIFVVQSIFI